LILEKILDLLSRISALYNIPQWIVNSAAVIIFVILVSSPFVARYLMRPKYYKFREMFLFKVLWRWKYKKGDIISLWCFCPKCGGMLICDDENCKTTDVLQEKITFFVCNECGGHELGRVVGGDRRYALSLVRREIWRHIKEGTYNEVSKATKEALEIYQQLEEEKAQDQQPLKETITLSTSEETNLPVTTDESIGVEVPLANVEPQTSHVPASTKDEPHLSQEEKALEEAKAAIHEKEAEQHGL
jgi:hypothetical protein